ncbi:RNA polymerase sigma factor [Paenibacillus tarimensis]|uniref:RNA polymerase sigma factor n=1 Tax=Paenibacillus tarimensis TaxID=416012 RepID=UPI001F340717|nr:RNA polymerase sigma factor [Paenibacillus tarimensis]MCF2942911.1 RNA polymerase sigma factor [Paenibacillus tarimensis]
MTDEELLHGMMRGDQASFEAFVHRYHAPLSGYLQRQLRDPGKAEDFVQETFVRLLKQLKLGKIPENAQAWLYRVALNLCRDYWKSGYYQSRQKQITDPPEQVDVRPSVVELAERQETRKEILASMSELPEVQKDIITLRFYQDMKLQDIANVLELPLGSVKTHLYKGLSRLKKKLLGEGSAKTDSKSAKGGTRHEHTNR